MFFVNQYGLLAAFDSAKICGYGDGQMHAEGVSELNVMDANKDGSGDCLNIPTEWADDEGCHYYGLTEVGHKIYLDD